MYKKVEQRELDLITYSFPHLQDCCISNTWSIFTIFIQALDFGSDIVTAGISFYDGDNWYGGLTLLFTLLPTLLTVTKILARYIIII